jgi:hypothetical protein
MGPVLTGAFARILVRTASAAKPLAFLAAPQPHRHLAQQKLLREICNVETVTRDDVTLGKGVLRTGVRVEPFVDVYVHRPLDLVKARDAFPVRHGVDASFNMQQMIRISKRQMHVGLSRKIGPFEGLDRDAVIHEQHLTAAREQTADIDFM